ncbi:hypothetical protein EVAR_93942_1 [Eumeta japonica]|uniref:Uncharacterized protein n=1 Tax=Eumeta variegata TaxID=151549 RepID=A0A4C1TP61_EUMVA|nr:hypothetical protein EVAR_93942_1 [Eumeta japonica]
MRATISSDGPRRPWTPTTPGNHWCVADFLKKEQTLLLKTHQSRLIKNATNSTVLPGKRSVWSGAIMVKNHTLSVDQSRPCFLYFLLELHQPLAVEIQLDGVARRQIQTAQPKRFSCNSLLMEYEKTFSPTLMSPQQTRNTPSGALLPTHQVYKRSRYIRCSSVPVRSSVLHPSGPSVFVTPALPRGAVLCKMSFRAFRAPIRGGAPRAGRKGHVWSPVCTLP